jgi:HEAT repeat protein
MKKVRMYIEDWVRSFDFEVTEGLWLVWLSSIILLFLAICFFVAVVISRYRKDYISRWELDFNQKVEALLLELIYGGYLSYEAWKSALSFGKFEKKYLQKARGQKLFIQIIATLRSRLNGEDATRLAEVYRKTGLYKTSLASLDNTSWQAKAAGIRELGALNYVEAVPAITLLSDYPHEAVRSMAQVALIQLDDSDPFGFLDALQNPISKSTMIRLHGAMLQKTSLELTTFARWLKSSHPDVVLFAATMSGLFNAAEDAQLLAQLIKHEQVRIAKAAIVSLEQLGAQETLTKEISKWNDFPLEIQLQLIQSLRNLDFRDEEMILRWLQSDFFEIVKAAIELYTDFKDLDSIRTTLNNLPPHDNLIEIKNQYAHFERMHLS